MTFLEQQNAIIDFIKTNYVNYLPNSFPIPTVTTDFLDFDKYKGDFTVFLDFSKINFQSRFGDDCEDSNTTTVSIFLINRNNTSIILNENNSNATYSFYQMIKANPSLGIANSITFGDIEFYKYVEGTQYLVCAEITITVDIPL
jgi:hypothetical protein